MDGAEHRTGNAAGPDPEPLLIAPAAILEGLPDAVVAMAVDGRIVYVNALAEELFGYTRDELVGRSVEMLWAKRMRERYMRNLLLYFETKHPLRFTAEAWGLRRDGTEFIGEMSWGIVAPARGRCSSPSAVTCPSSARRRRGCGRSPRWGSGRWPGPSRLSSPPRPCSSSAAGCR